MTINFIYISFSFFHCLGHLSISDITVFTLYLPITTCPKQIFSADGKHNYSLNELTAEKCSVIIIKAFVLFLFFYQ